MPTVTPPLPHTPGGGSPARVALLQLKLGFVAYDEILTVVEDGLRAIGANVRRVADAREADPSRDDALLIVGSPNFYPRLLDDLTALRARHGGAMRVLLWHLEHLPDLDTPAPALWAHVIKSWADARRQGGRYGNSRAGNYLAIRAGVRRGLFDRVFVFTPRKAEFLRRHGVAAEFLPLGHHPLWGEDAGGERDIAALFLGEVLDDRRGQIVRAVAAELARDGIALRTMYDFNPVGVWGAERNALLNRTKVFLSVYRHPADSSGMRFSLGMGNGALVVSEPVADPAPFVPGEHFIQAPIPQLAAAVRDALRDQDRRRRVTEAASRFLHEHYAIAQSAARLADAARSPLDKDTA